MRDSVGSSVAEMGKRIMQVAAEHPEYMRKVFRQIGRELSDQDLNKLTEAITTGGIEINATKIAWLRSTTNAHEIARMLYRMPWIVAEAPASFEFLTSDAPIAKVLTDRSVPRMFAGGWISPSAESTFALDPKRCLVIRPDGKAGRLIARKPWSKDVNSRLIGQANRFVISRSRDSYVETVARKRPERDSAKTEGPAGLE
jgi:hypothetical protein